VVRNAALNMVRSGARQVDVSEDAAEAIDDQAALAAYASAGDPFELRADLGRLDNCLQGLEPARRDCILYAYVEGCSHGEIAERLQTPLGTVKAWIQRGMRALRECMA
jgi:RNA polymerase sigma-70 factor (ECF subfamily)